MTLFRMTLLILSLSLFGFGCGDSAPDSAADAKGDEADEDEGEAEGEDEAVAEAKAAPADKAAPAKEAATGKASARMVGTWGISLPAAEMEKLAAARKTLEANPEDPQAKMMVAMMDTMLGAMKLDVTGDSLTMGAGDKTQTISYEVTEDSDASCTLKTKEADGKEAVIKVTYDDAGIMTWTKAGEPQPLMWAKK